MNSIELEEKIEERSGVDFDVPKLAHFVWFQGPNGVPTVFTVGQPLPFKAGAVVYAMFRSDDVVNVYALGSSPKAEDKTPPMPPSRYTFSCSAPTYTVEVMTLDVFIDEIADEYQMLAFGEVLEPDDEEKPSAPNVAHEEVAKIVEAVTT